MLIRVLELDQKRPEVFWALAQCQREPGSVEEALKTLNQLADLTPNDAGVFREIGMLYLNGSQQPELAKRYFSQSIRLNPDQPDLMQMLMGSTAAAPGVETPNLAGVPGLPTVAVPNSAIDGVVDPKTQTPD